MTLAARLKRLWTDDDGTALLEGAIVLPCMLALVMGALEFSFFFYHQHLVSTGVRDAARYLARTDPGDATMQTNAQNLASTGSIAGGTVRRVTGFDPADVGITFTYLSNAAVSGVRPHREPPDWCGDPAAATPQDWIRIIVVTGTYQYSSLGLLSSFGVTIPTTHVRHRERCIGMG
jgi:Flp pilus assembly protein TadG